MSTAYHARYGALELRRREVSGEVEALGSALLDARVDLNPHQIEAALFGLRATAESGRLLADEVGLGKTIEAALVLCQRWAERRRRLLVVCPAAIRKQWCSELESKFGLPVRLVEGRADANPFDVPAVAVASYPYAARRASDLAAVPWDLVVFDEAHGLRNAWKSDSRQSAALLSALSAAPKLLLTATPLQSSLLELYGLVSVLDPHVFGDVDAFKARFVKGRPDLAALRERLRGVSSRTLRRSVLPCIQYTSRRSLTERFRSSPEERRLYGAVSELLARDDLLCLPRWEKRWPQTWALDSVRE
ncbi:MAG: hypothetical protein AMXMBFR64_50580 [Myxococcales bacterium]